MNYYKIRSRNNPELYRKADGTWNNSGKTYDTIGKLRAIITQHLNSYSDRHRRQLDDWEIVEYEVTVKAVRQLHEIVKPEKIVDLLKRDYGQSKHL